MKFFKFNPVNFRLANTPSNHRRMGFGGGGTSTSTQSSGPWSGQQGYLSDVFSKAQDQYNNYTPQTYTQATGQSTVADMNPTETSAIANTANLGLNGSSSTNAANTALTNTLSANPASNPYQDQMDAITMSKVVPGLESQFNQGNRMNSGSAAYSVANGAADALAGQHYAQYNQNIANQNAAANTAQGLYQTQLGGNQAALSAGQAQQTQDQNKLDNLVNSFNYQQQLPYTKLNQYTNTVNGQYGNSTTSTKPTGGLFSSLFG